jgi:hypothetical protein
MKRGLLNRDTVDLGLSAGDPAEYIQSPFFSPPANARFFYKSTDVFPGIVGPPLCPFVPMSTLTLMTAVIVVPMPAHVVMTAIIVVPMSTLTLMTAVTVVPMPVLVVVTAVMAVEKHRRVGAGDATPLVTVELQLPALKMQFGKLPPQIVRLDTDVHKGAQSHITGDTGETIEVKGLHTPPPAAAAPSSTRLRLPIR